MNEITNKEIDMHDLYTATLEFERKRLEEKLVKITKNLERLKNQKSNYAYAHLELIILYTNMLDSMPEV